MASSLAPPAGNLEGEIRKRGLQLLEEGTDRLRFSDGPILAPWPRNAPSLRLRRHSHFWDPSSQTVNQKVPFRVFFASPYCNYFSRRRRWMTYVKIRGGKRYETSLKSETVTPKNATKKQGVCQDELDKGRKVGQKKIEFEGIFQLLVLFCAWWWFSYAMQCA